MKMTTNDEVKIELNDASVAIQYVASSSTVENDAMPILSTIEAIEIGHSSDVLKKAHYLVSEAYDLISHDKIVKKYLDLMQL